MFLSHTHENKFFTKELLRLGQCNGWKWKERKSITHHEIQGARQRTLANFEFVV